MHRLMHYGLATLGPAGSAGGQFLLTFMLLSTVSAEQFGAFSFLLVLAQFMQGVWSALFCAPLLIALSRDGAAPHDNNIAGSGEQIRRVSALFQMSAFILAPLFMGGAGIALLMHLSSLEALIFSCYITLNLCRWLGRSHFYAMGIPARTQISDICYAFILTALAIILWGTGRLNLTSAMMALLMAAIIGYALLAPAGLRAMVGTGKAGAWRDYIHAWRGQARWALTGVVTTEATANAHAYIVTGLMGAAAFAPLAATALIIRPANVVVNALEEYERARMARVAGAGGSLAEMTQMLRLFRVALIILWAGTVTLALLMQIPAAQAWLPAHYAPATLATGMMLWLLVQLFRFARIPESTYLQAMDCYRPLALASVISCLFSVCAVLAILVIAGPIWSIAGLAIGEAAFAIWTWRAASRTRMQQPPA